MKYIVILNKDQVHKPVKHKTAVNLQHLIPNYVSEEVVHKILVSV